MELTLMKLPNIEIGDCIMSYNMIIESRDFGHVVKITDSNVVLASYLTKGGYNDLPRKMPMDIHVVTSIHNLVKKTKEIGFPNFYKKYNKFYRSMFLETYGINVEDELELTLLINSFNILFCLAPQVNLATHGPVIGL